MREGEAGARAQPVRGRGRWLDTAQTVQGVAGDNFCSGVDSDGTRGGYSAFSIGIDVGTCEERRRDLPESPSLAPALNDLRRRTCPD